MMMRISECMAVVAILFVASLSAAQEATVKVSLGNLSGRISEFVSKQGIPDMTVKLIPSREGKEPERVTTTGSDGVYRFSKIREGKYLVELYRGVTLLYREVVEVKNDVRKDFTLKKKTH